ncbi:histidine phosphatase family protein [Thermoleophilia bacterium SCSIO 60948]|nr:histidine phosphatase family protein [Thermoleophilia bacterium SCSIO 60948]
MRVIFIRHGESRSNAATDVVALPASEGDRLTERGWAQAGEAGRWLARLGSPDLLLASPMRRAQETAEAIAGELDGPPVRFETEPSIVELSESSDYADLAVEEQIAQRWATRMARNAHDSEHAIGDGESFADMIRRVRAAKRRLESEDAELVFAVSHGIFLRFFWLDTVLGDGFGPAIGERMWQLGSFNCALSEFELRDAEDAIKDPAPDRWRARTWMSRPWESV